MDGVEEFTAAEGILERIAFAIFSKIFLLFSLTAINLDGVTAEVAEHSEEVFR